MLIPIVIGILITFQDICTGYFVFRGSKTVLFHPLCFPDHGCQGILDLIFRTARDHSPGIFCLGYEVVAVISISRGERSIRLLDHFSKTLVHHGGGCIQYILRQVTGLCVFQLLRHRIMFVKHHDAGIPCFGIRRNGNDRLFVVGNRVILACGPFRIESDGRKQRFYLLFHLVYIHIAYHNDALQVGTVPFVVISPDLFRFEVVDDVDAADGHPFGILAAGIHLGKQLIPQSLLRPAPCAPLFADHAAFFFNLLFFQSDGIGPVMQHQKS